jgi:hypothetical protein
MKSIKVRSQLMNHLFTKIKTMNTAHYLLRIAIVICLVMGIANCTLRKEKAPLVISLPSPAASPSAEPYLFTATDGSVYLSWVKDVGDKSEMYLSKWENDQWTSPTLIDSGRNWFVNWADYPMIVSNQNNFMASYLQMSGPGKYSYDIKVATSNDSGRSWSKSFALNDDGKEAEHGFTSFVPYHKDFFVSWLDGRNTVPNHSENHHHDGQPAMSLRGAVLNSQGQKTNEWELDNRTCDCCGTSAAITSKGPVVVYRDRTEKEVRDISIVRLIDGVWTKPKEVFNDGWVIKGCPVNGPKIISQDHNMAVAWFSMPNDKPQVKVVFSNNDGESFSKPVRVDKGNPIGRVDMEWLDKESAFVMWMEKSTIIGARVEPTGVVWRINISASSEARSSGFPQVTRHKNQLILAWTDDQIKQVKTATINL